MGLLWVSQFANTAGLMMLIPVMPFYVRDLGAAVGSVGLWAGAAIAAPALPLAMMTPWWGRLGDRVGQQWMVVRALIGLAVAMALMAVASSPLALVVARLVQGAAGGVVEAAAAFVGAESTRDGRATAMGRSYSATAAGALAGPLAGGIFMSTGRLDLLLLAVASSAILLAVLCTFLLKSRRTIESPPAGRSSEAGDRRARKEIGLPVLLGAVLMFFGVYGLIPVYAEYIAFLLDKPYEAAAWVGGLHSIMWAGTMAGSLFWASHNERHGKPLGTLCIASALTAGTMIIQAWIPWLIVLVPLRFAQGFSFAALAQSLLLYASERAPEGRRAEFVGVANSYPLYGQFLGPLCAGALLGSLSPSTTATVAGCAVAVGALLTRRGGPVHKHRAEVGAATESGSLGLHGPK